MTELNASEFRTLITSVFPELTASVFKLAAKSWDSLAVDVDDTLIFKFPRHPGAERALVKEAALLDIIRPSLSIAVPDMRIHDGPPIFSSHAKLEGEHLIAEDYDALREGDRQHLAEDLARFYAELHVLDADRIRSAGAGPIQAWQSSDAVRTKALPLLPPEIGSFAQAIISDFEALPPDPHGKTYGFFDGHGWNMAFDHAQKRLNGIYDFADSGFGPLHQEFIYSNFISPDLTARIVSAYEMLTGRKLDRRRIAILTGFHRLSELAELADDPAHVELMVRNVATWAAAAHVA
ncbi:aminoglycoside phosphotransferase (APT) family kinase protein [Rhizobium leguminosarum]|uniref:Aminoglycoside phosphotransferase (APT) family kinase protein n=1 Tax=Rhizobium leguminosarum TaxID=384 RepID=A0AAE2MGR5_RHILE|nr:MULTISPECIES: aminoglycoside phosphotransferase family protein [Rhizobium]MBB4289143.1 aminoglycoside phosphotransferase (APT) family kinase protein [Rhizobium leguminosarum]MBB4294763.1 aminoglycoside phosphotransferase (APT) family kinase protein [Rhizobium leguminosarum]MBB4306157.1 aminoglycoside phosphotransferase (APT) family kinase protein [Rhizobium leguminosarum]MBB4418264.1 aminoglycoside phosphotransferase (APT) family kinase protein [Rhizobium leguminosarum]MBB4433109.1 aminogly